MRKAKTINSKQSNRVSVAKLSSSGVQTSKSVAKKASNILRDSRSGKATKSVAGSSLTQTSSRPKKSVFLRAARSLKLDGPPDWSTRFKEDQNGRKK
ncbi:MAG: hypothetical protein DMF61_12195 [Blastocatellia bacterium AA13]|nr:MAG: hypothetical protein DMF61_12195 [Blastocatellia bacterium AA13]